MKKIYLSVVCLLISIPLIAQLYVEPEKEVECSVFLAKEGRGRAQQGLEIWDDYIFSCEDGGHVNIYDFKSADPKPVAGFELASSHPDNHVNNVCFGVETKRGASFPLLYITNGKVGSELEWLCFVEIRGKAVAIAVAFQWIFNYIVSSTFVVENVLAAKSYRQLNSMARSGRRKGMSPSLVRQAGWSIGNGDLYGYSRRVNVLWRRIH